MKIHPTAIVDPAAKLAEDVTVGPWSIIEAGVRIGTGTTIGAQVQIHCGTTIGQNNIIYPNVILGGDPQHLSFDQSTPTELVIGDHNIFREFCNIHRSSKLEQPTTIASHNFFMASTHLGHDCIVGSHNVMTQGAICAGHVEIADRIFISGLVAVHQFVRIGSYAMIAGLAKVTRDVPPYCLVDGNPAAVAGLNNTGLKRAGFDRDQRAAIYDAYKTIYHSGKTTSEALKLLFEKIEGRPELEYIHRFAAESPRGITDFAY